MADLPTGTVTFLFTDIEGSTPLWEQHLETMRGAVARHHTILREAIEASHGRVFNIAGDAFCSAFATASDALAAALAAQRALSQADWGETSIRVRMGLHTGDAEAVEGDYRSGPTLNRVARVMSIAYGGQILLSQITAGLVRGQLPHGVSLRDMGEHRLKGLADLERILQVVTPDLLTDFPPLKSLSTIPNNLPAQLTSFIGREREMTEVKRLLTNTRLLTLTGAGGTGKTRLSLAVAGDWLDQYPDGVWFIELAPLTDPALVPQIVSSAMGVHEEPGRPMLATLTDHLHDKHLLLVLDNCEHLNEACARFADTTLRIAPRLKILTSSRETLGIAGETAYHVPSLPIPNLKDAIPTAAVAKYDSVRLFVERAQAAKSSFILGDVNALAVAEICHRLDGIPLAIELAAARIKAFSAKQIAERLDDRFRLLTGGSRTALPRQQTLRALIDWSYGLLSGEGRVLLRRLSVFAGGWSFEAAETVCTLEPIEVAAMPDLMTHLVEKSLVVADEEAGEVRYHMLETIRQYAHERLLESGEDKRVRERHLHFFMCLAEEAEPKLLSPQQEVWMNRLEMEHDNLRVAIECARTSDKAAVSLRLVGALRLFWLWRGYWSEGIEHVSDALSQPAAAEATIARAKALITVGHLQRGRANYADTHAPLEEALAIAQALQDNHSTALARLYLGSTFALEGNHAVGRQQLEESVRIFRQLGDHAGMGESLEMLADSFRSEGDYGRAKAHYEESVALLRQLGDGYHLGYALRGLGAIARHQGNIDEAIAAYHDSLEINVGLRNKRGIAASLVGLAGVATARGQLVTAARLCSAADALLESAHTQLLTADRTEYERVMTSVRAQLDPETFDSAWAEGHALTIEQAIALALKDRDE